MMKIYFFPRKQSGIGAGYLESLCTLHSENFQDYAEQNPEKSELITEPALGKVLDQRYPEVPFSLSYPTILWSVRFKGEPAEKTIRNGKPHSSLEA